MESEVRCAGRQCPNRNQCLRFTAKGEGRVMAKCTNGKMFVQDITKINGDSLKR